MDHTLNPWKEPFLVSPLYSQTEPAVFLFLKGKLKVLEAFPKPLKDSYKQTNKQTERMNTKESRFFERPREMKVGLKNRKFEDSKVL